MSIEGMYINDIYDEGPLLTAEEEWALSERIQNGDEYAIQELTEANVRLVVNLARTYAFEGSKITLLDLIEAGNTGLMQAAQTFDHTFKTRFSTHAGFWIKKEMLFILKKKNLISIPFYLQQFETDQERAQTKLTEELGREPTDDEMAEKMNYTLRKYRSRKKSLILAGMANVSSTNNGEDDDPLPEFVDRRSQSDTITLERNDTLRTIFEMLPYVEDERAPEMIAMRYGINTDIKTIKEIAEHFMISTGSVKKIINSTLQTIREEIGMEIGDER